MDLSTDIGGIKLKNPVICASGTFGYGVEFEDILDLNSLGGISVKGLHIHPKEGNAPQRITETPCGMINAIGLQGIGITAFIEEKLPILKKYNTAIIVNFWGTTIQEYESAVDLLNQADGIAALELNASCPNVKAGGMTFGTDPKILGDLVKAVRKKTTLPLIIKLSPNVTSIGEMAKVAESQGADSISLVNTFSAMAINVDTRKPILSNNVGGLSGPAIRPIAVKMVWDAANSVRIPVLGMGGIMNARDALEFIIAGASAVQIGTAHFVNPLVALEVIDGIRNYCVKNNFDNFKSLIGSLEVN